MHAWIFRHRHGLRSVYGLPPEERLAPLLESARANRVGERAAGPRMSRTISAPESDPELARVRQLTLRPWPRRA